VKNCREATTGTKQGREVRLQLRKRHRYPTVDSL
jgi:hypothetical protein